MRFTLFPAGRTKTFATAFVTALAALFAFVPAVPAQTMVHLAQKPPVAASDDPAKVAAARQFITLYHPHSDPRAVADQMNKFMPQMIAAAKQHDPKLDAKKFAAERRAAILDRVAKSLDLQAHVVSRHFSLAELKQLAGFFGSPLGRKLTDETPKIQKDLMLLGPLRGMGSPSQRMTIGRSQAQTPAKPAPHTK